MKKTWLLPLLLVGLMAGCANEGESASATTSKAGNSEATATDTKTADQGNTTPQKVSLGDDPTVEGGTLKGKFNITHIQGVYDKSNQVDHGIWLSGYDELESEFTNEVTGGHAFKDVQASSRSCDRSQISQGPNIGGIKIYSNKAKSSGNIHEGGLTFTMPDGVTTDVVVARFRAWENPDHTKAEPFTLIVNGNQENLVEKQGVVGEYVDVVINKTDMTTFDFKCKFLGDEKDNRPTLCGIYTFDL